MKLKYVAERFPTPFEFGKHRISKVPCFTCGFGTGHEFDLYADADQMKPLQDQIDEMQRMILDLLNAADKRTVDHLWYGAPQSVTTPLDYTVETMKKDERSKWFDRMVERLRNGPPITLPPVVFPPTESLAKSDDEAGPTVAFDQPLRYKDIDPGMVEEGGFDKWGRSAEVAEKDALDALDDPDGPFNFLFATGSKDALPDGEYERRFMKLDFMVGDMAGERKMGHEHVMDLKLDRARIGLKLLDTGNDALTETCLTYPGIPIIKTVDLNKGNYHYHAMQDVFRGDLVGYLREHGIKATWYD